MRHLGEPGTSPCVPIALSLSCIRCAHVKLAEHYTANLYERSMSSLLNRITRTVIIGTLMATPLPWIPVLSNIAPPDVQCVTKSISSSECSVKESSVKLHQLQIFPIQKIFHVQADFGPGKHSYRLLLYDYQRDLHLLTIVYTFGPCLPIWATLKTKLKYNYCNHFCTITYYKKIGEIINIPKIITTMLSLLLSN